MFTLLASYRNPPPNPPPNPPRRLRPRLVLIACAALVGACGGRQVEGSGTPIEETRPLADATRVVVHGEGLLVLVQGDEVSLRITADDNIVPLLRSEVARGVLTLGLEDGVNVDPETPIVYHLTLPSIEEVEMSGATTAEIGPVTAQRFSLRTSGASHVEAESVEADSVAVESSGASSIEAAVESSAAHVVLSGSSHIVLRGRTGDQEIDVSGASEYRGAALRSHRAEARASGSSEASVFADESLRVEGSGASSVRHHGGGRLSRFLSGAASVDGE